MNDTPSTTDKSTACTNPAEGFPGLQQDLIAWQKKAEHFFGLPLLDLLYQAHSQHRKFHDPADIQRSTLISVKTGGCSEDCGYCPQSAHYETEVEREELMPLAEVVAAAKAAKKSGSQRLCMGAAWREVKDGPDFDRILDMVSAVAAEDLEVCCTLGMLSEDQAIRLKKAGLHAYNHNLDSSRDFYQKIIGTRQYEDRLNTLKAVREADITVCSGGILGMGETEKQRADLLAELAAMDPQPESVPINMLVAIDGTPLGDSPAVDPLEWIRAIAVARLLMPKSRVRLSAGRASLTREAQVMAFFAGANSIFLGDKLLTTANPEVSEDEALLACLQGRESKEKS